MQYAALTFASFQGVILEQNITIYVTMHVIQSDTEPEDIVIQTT